MLSNMLKDHTHHDLPDHPFWQFSLQIYSHPDVKQALLTLQNAYYLNTNILLLCCWLAKTGRGRLKKHNIKILINQITLWHEQIIHPLRQLRNQLKNFTHIPNLAKIRQEILQTELETEHTEQLLLIENFSSRSARRKSSWQKSLDAYTSIINYCIVSRIKINSANQELINILLKFTLPQVTSEMIINLEQDGAINILGKLDLQKALPLF